MENIYNVNGLLFFTEKEIRLRRQFEDNFYNEIKDSLLSENRAWQFHQIEAPLLTPRSIVNSNYTNNDIFVQETNLMQFELKFRNFFADYNNLPTIGSWINVESQNLSKSEQAAYVEQSNNYVTSLNDSLVKDIESEFFIPTPALNDLFMLFIKKMNLSPVELVLRPETTPGSYEYAKYLFDSGTRPPVVIWQSGKSFRRENDQPNKHCRFKEFYQQEFQCIFTEDTKNDYQSAILPKLKLMFEENIGLPCRIVESDRLPSYSMKTMDVEVFNEDKWMEICSVSLRKDFSNKIKFTTKTGSVEKACLVLEVAIGLDRCVYNYTLRKDLKKQIGLKS